MRLELNKECWLARARREGNAAVSAALLAFDPAPEERLPSARIDVAEESRIAFGKFVHPAVAAVCRRSS